MNRTLKLLAAVTLIALTAAACQKEKLFDSQTAGEETVTFTVQTDAAATKATADNDGDGAGLNRCLVAVYMKTGNSAEPYKLYDTPSTTKQDNEHYSFTVNLIRKQTYQIVVWADKGEAVYDVNNGLTSVTRIANDKACNSDAYDAFYASTEFVQGSATSSTSIVATRPFAQLNLITKDLNKDFQPGAVTVTYSSPQSFNPFDGTVSADMTEVTYKADSPYYNPTTVTTATQHTLVMNYLFAAAGDQTILPSVKMTAKLTVDAEIEVANVPVKRNYRTNIIGNLLTEQTDFTITVEPDWSTPESDYIFVAPGVRQFVDNEYEIYAKEGLDWLAKTVNGGNTLSGKTVKLSADLDMTGIDYVPAGNTIAGYSSRTFAGVFDGQGHTISNLSVASHTGVYSAAGLFGTITGTVKNVKLANVNISSDHYAGGVVGYISANTGASVQNCSVEGGSIKSTAHLMDDGSYDDGDKAGGIVGYITAVDYVDGCSVKNLTITAYRDLGAIVGCAAGSGTVKVTNCTVGDNVLVVVDNSHNCEGFTTNEEHNAGNFVGRKLTSVDETGSTGEAQIVYPEANAVATVNGTSYATLAEAVSAAPDGSTLMILEPQVLSSPTASLEFGAGKSVTVMGAGEGSVIDASAKSSSVACSGDITFVNMTFKFNQGSTQHYNIGLHNGGGTQVYENCKFEGQTVAWGNTTYNNCEFTSTVKYAAWVYSGTVVYNNCKFSGVDRAVKVFDEGPALDVTYNNCTFSCQSPNKAAVEVDVTCNATNLVKVAINNPVLEGTFGNAEHWGTQYFNLEGGAGCNGVVTIDGKTYAKVATNNAFDVAVNETAKEIDVRMTGPCGITTSDFYNKLGGPETTVINIDGNGNALTVNSAYRNHIKTDNNAKIVLKNVTMDSNYKVEGSTWDDYGLIFDCPTEFTNVTFNRQLALSQPYKHILNNVTINQTAATGDMYALWIEAGADVTFNGGAVNAVSPNGNKNRAIKIADQYVTNPQLTKLNVSGVTFKSDKKAAVLVTSTAGADIIWGEGNDISNVAADQTNAVWNDADRTAAWDLVTVTGCTKYQEQ